MERCELQEWYLNISKEVVLSKGEYSPPCLTLIECSNNTDDKFVIVSHLKGILPSKRNLITKQSQCEDNYLWYEVTCEKFKIIEKAILSWNENKNPSLMSYTYLYAYCKALGVDLHKDLRIM